MERILLWISVTCTVLSTVLFSATVWTVHNGQIFSAEENIGRLRVTRELHETIEADAQHPLHEGGHERGRRQATRIRCEGNELRTLAFRGGSEGAKYHRLSCAVLKLKELLDTFSNDFNGMVFFVNNVGAGVQDIRTAVEQNQKAITDIGGGGGGVSDDTVRNLTSTFMSQVDQKLDELNVNSLQDLLNEQEDTINQLKVQLEVEQQKTEWLMGENQKLYYAIDEMNVTLQSAQPSVIFIGNSNATNGTDAPAFVDAPIFPGLLSAGIEEPALNASLSRIETVEENVKRVSALMTSMQGSIKRLDDSFEDVIADEWFNAPNGYQYFLSKAGYKTDSYARSKRYCGTQNAEIAHIGMRDSFIYRFLWNNLLGPGNHYCIWIGLSDAAVEGKWKWADDKSIDDYWTNWRQRRRTTHALSSIKDCVMIRNGLWEEGTCSGLHQKVCSFVCERKTFRWYI